MWLKGQQHTAGSVLFIFVVVAEGFARACQVAPNSAFSSDLATLEQEAEDQGVGRWGEPCLGGPECFQGGN